MFHIFNIDPQDFFAGSEDFLAEGVALLPEPLLEIAPASYADLEEIYQLESEIEGPDGADLVSLMARWRMFGAGFLTARQGGQLLGYIETCLWDCQLPHFEARPDFFTSRHRLGAANLYIIFLGVAADYRRQGVASSLLAAVSRVGWRYGARRLQAVSRSHIVPLYEAAGFLPVAAMPGFLPEPGTDFMLMERPFL
ncbi:MAG TPA: GNAT family N-acetyltransferase [Desulfobacterales bacterium]|nr:GNAT family N-acetyltransferase [Desulfobacterales bacterium]